MYNFFIIKSITSDIEKYSRVQILATTNVVFQVVHSEKRSKRVNTCRQQGDVSTFGKL